MFNKYIIVAEWNSKNSGVSSESAITKCKC